MMVDESKQKYAPQHKDLRFKTEAEFNKWLEATARYHVKLEDQGQDLLGLWLDEGGEIIYTDIPQMGGAFNGQLISLFNLQKGEPPEIMDVKAMANRQLRYSVTKIEVLKVRVRA